MQSRHPRRGFPLINQRALFLLFAILAVLLFPRCVQARQKARAENPDEYWINRVEPLLDKYCLKCHAGVRQQGGLDLRSLETILRGGNRGPALIPGKPDESRIVEFVQPKAESHMPPDPKKQLSAQEIAVLKNWVALLPAPKSKLASDASTKNTWVPEYLAEYRRALRTPAPPPPNLSGSAAIDWFLQTRWKRDKIEPAHLSDDATFARRVTLDLAGRIPTTEELNRFLADPGSDKRQRLVAALLTSDDYPRHMREVFDTVLMGRPTGRNARERAARGWYAYLEESFRANRPWNEMVRDILVARPTDSSTRGAVWFLAERKNSHQAIAEAVAPVAFGVQIKCAQCHNHPLAWEIEQRHYWGLVTAFNRSKNVDTANGPMVAESAIGGFINFANLKKESQPATLVFLNGKSIPERIPAADEKEVDSPDKYRDTPGKDGQKAQGPSIPRFSRREAFAEAVTNDNPLLARAFANRIWAYLMGRGIVQPADQIDSRHRPSHPELLEWLGRDFEQSGYDIKRLVQNIVLSRAYQLDSKPSGKKPPRPESFARALEKPLSAEQFARSLWIATGNKPDTKSAEEMERSFVTTFPDLMPDTYSPTLQQALFLTNSPILNGLLKPTSGSTTAQLLALPSNEARVRQAFRIVLGRSPDAAELKPCQSLLAAQSPEQGIRNLLWALLTSAEFQVNH